MRTIGLNDLILSYAKLFKVSSARTHLQEEKFGCVDTYSLIYITIRFRTFTTIIMVLEYS